MEGENDHLDLDAMSGELCKIDKKFPASDLWTEYYNMKMKNIMMFTVKKNNKLNGVL